VAYIGGGFGAGIHNILEAATYGVPVIFGPNYQKFREAVELSERGGAFPIQNANDCISIFTRHGENATDFQEAGMIARNYVLKNGGATAKILEKSREFLSR
jgi:3-deoxy-D-manno-octulosonic-acid transferase